MNRREFLTGAATAAASLFMPRVNPEPKYTDGDVDRLPKVNKELIAWGRRMLEELDRAYCENEALVDQVEALCVERDELIRQFELRIVEAQMWKQRCAELERENHELGFELWGWSMAFGGDEDWRDRRTSTLLNRYIQRRDSAYHGFQPRLSDEDRRVLEDLPPQWMQLLPPDVAWSGHGIEDGEWHFSLFVPVNKGESF